MNGKDYMTHVLASQDATEAPCGMSADKLVDPCGAEPAGYKPTCPRCARWANKQAAT